MKKMPFNFSLKKWDIFELKIALHKCITCQTKHVLIAKKVENCKKNHESSVLKFWWTNYRFGRQNSNDTRVTQMFIVLRFWSLSCSRWLHFSLRWISNIAHRSTPRNRLPCEPWNYRPFHQLLMTWSPKTDDWVEFDIHWPIWSFSPNVDYNSQKPKKKPWSTEVQLPIHINLGFYPIMKYLR